MRGTFDNKPDDGHGSRVTTPPTSNPLVNGRDLLRSQGLPVEGPVLWGKPILGGGPGVFIVEMAAPAPKVSINADAIREWLGRAPDLRLDGKYPSVADLQSRLASFWLPSQAILYIGSSQKSVSARVAGIYKTPLGERRPQSAGYWLKTLKDLTKTRIWWAPTNDPELYEDQLIEAFVKDAGDLPYALHAVTREGGRSHGLTTPLHDVVAPKPVKVTKVTVLPDAGEDEMALSSAPTGRRPAAPKAAPKPRTTKPKVKPSPQVGPSAIETPVVRRSSKAVLKATPIIQTHLTPEGLIALQRELDDLTIVKRPEVISRIKAARELGDLRENADYEAARKEQSFLEGRVLQIEQMIKNAVIIEQHSDQPGNEVVLGSTVTVETDRHGQETFTIVGSAEADAASGKISFTSPIGRALIGRRAGETVRVTIPAGTMDFKLVNVH
jgi:transcription elongation factor GreA